MVPLLASEATVGTVDLRGPPGYPLLLCGQYMLPSSRCSGGSDGVVELFSEQAALVG